MADSNHQIIPSMTPFPLFGFNYSTSSASAASAQSSFIHHSPSQDDESPPLVAKPCGACKGLRRRCDASCILAPYFPPTQPLKFLAVHKVFGASNISKVLQGIPESQRSDAVKSMVYEARTRIRDPVYGCVGVICSLQKLVNQLQMELATAKAQLLNITYQQENLPAVATVTCMEMKEAQQPSWDNFSMDDSFPPFYVTDSRGI